MILNYRIYATLYAIIALAWAFALPLIQRAKPGTITFREHMDFVDRYMLIVMIAAAVIGFVNFADWLWA